MGQRTTKETIDVIGYHFKQLFLCLQEYVWPEFDKSYSMGLIFFFFQDNFYQLIISNTYFFFNPLKSLMRSMIFLCILTL